jgi:hypothetical protein
MKRRLRKWCYGRSVQPCFPHCWASQQWHPAFFVATCGAMLLALAGCSRESARHAIEGTVTLDGQSLKQGYICFRPEQGTKSPTAGTEISAGKFSIPASGGTFAGRFRVEITAGRATVNKVRDRFTGQIVAGPAFEQYLPACYNTETTLRADVSESGTAPFAFALRSSGKASP